MQLNRDQKAAVRHRDGPALVLAGPGSGKTAVITERTLQLIQKANVPAKHILVVTFSRKAAEEMQRRFLRMNSGTDCPTFGTFHSVFYRILKRVYQIGQRSLLTEEEKYRQLKAVCRGRLNGIEESEAFYQTLLREISCIKSGSAYIENFIPSSLTPAEFRSLFHAYQHHLRRAGKIDFDDMVLLCLRLFRERADILRLYQTRFRYILIDEFQDISPLQYETIRLLAAPENNLFVVGDDDQSIYAFRGAKPDLMQTFVKDYPSAVRITLRTNYRCAPAILEISQRLIRQNKTRFAKRLVCGRSGSRGRVVLRKCPDLHSEYMALSRDIRDVLRKGAAFEDIAILVRNTKEVPFLLNVLNQNRIPVREAVRNAADPPDFSGLSEGKKKPGIAVMTMHGAKGLEFEHVFLPDLNEGILPGRPHLRREQIEEERRIFYVALTRAAQSLHLYYCEKRSQKNVLPSRFLQELSGESRRS